MNKHSKGWLSESGKKIIVDIICYLFVLLFLYAATSKLMDTTKFQLQMSKSPIITNYASILVWLVPTLEIIISIFLLINRTVKIGLFAALILMCLFTAYIYAILNFSDTVPCSCGGILEAMKWPEHLMFNIVFIVLAVAGILLEKKTKNKEPG